MITNFADFCLWTYAVVDELYQQPAPVVRHPGPQPACTDN